MERWDIFTADGLPTGKTVVRGNVRLSPGEYHLVVHIWVLAPDGRLLIQRRSDTKELMAGEWAAIGGAAVAGEDSLTAAKRELQEEMGINADEQRMTLMHRIVRKNSFVDLYLCQADVTLDMLTLQESEVAEAMWVTPDELEQMIADGNYHNYGSDYFELVLAFVRQVIQGEEVPR